MATIYDVARRAGVSIGTVSRVLNERRAVAPDTRRSVLAAIEALGYHPNALARGLLSARTRSLGMLVPDLANPMAVSMIRGAEGAAWEHGYTLLLGDAHDDEAVEQRHLVELLERRVDGLLCFTVAGARTIRERVQQAGVPTILLARARPDPVLPTALVDERPAFAAAVQDLIRLGHERIAMVVKSQPYGGGRERTAMLREQLAAAGTPLRPEYLLLVEDAESCRDATMRLLRLPEPPTALIAGLHDLAPVCLEAARLCGCRIPADLSFVTFGDSHWALAFPAPLSVVTTDAVASCAAATELLLRHVNGDETAPRTSTIVAEYIRRGSCGPAPN